MKPIIRAGVALIAVAGCTPAQVAPSPLLVGVFAGDLPCADCSGMATRLTLVRRGSDWAEGRYLMVQTYTGRSAPPVVTTGEWTTLRGDAVYPDSSVYQLDPDRPQGSQNFLKEGETRLRMLDPSSKRLPAELPQTLERQTQDLRDAKAVDCLRGGGVATDGGTCVRR